MYPKQTAGQLAGPANPEALSMASAVAQKPEVAEDSELDWAIRYLQDTTQFLEERYASLVVKLEPVMIPVDLVDTEANEYPKVVTARASQIFQIVDRLSGLARHAGRVRGNVQV